VRRAVGAALHARYQAAARASDPDLSTEVPLHAHVVHRNWDVRVHGRADLVRRTQDGRWCIEELKSRWPGAEPSGELAALHRRQVALYAWMWEREHGTRAAAALIWLPIGDGEPVTEPVETDPAALETGLRAALDAWLVRLARDAARSAARRRAAPLVRLPHSAPRPGQPEIAAAVEHALEHREHLLVEAPTGLGKTEAALAPALRHALAHDRRLFVLTATGLQARQALAALERMAPAGLAAGVRLAAKARLCANDRLACHEAACSFARDYGAKLAAAALPERLFDGRAALGPAALRAAGAAAGACPHELALDAARGAVVTVADYNHVFDPRARVLAPDDEAFADAILLVDEVHNLPRRVRASFTCALDGVLVRRAAGRAACGGAPLHRAQEELCRALGRALDEAAADACGAGPTPDVEAEIPGPPDALAALLPRADAALLAALAYRAATRAFDADDPFLDVAFALAALLRPAPGAAGRVAWTAGRRGGAPFVRRVCLEAGAVLAPVLRRCHAFVGLSATLSPIELYRAELGLDPARAVHARLPEPFPPAHRRVVIDPSVDTRLAARGRAAPRVARRLTAFAAAVPGNTLALLPSHDFLAEVLRHLEPARRRVLAQRRADGEEARVALLDALARADDLLVLAVAGGVFAEGLDLPSGRLRAVAVVSPCLPAPSLQRRLRAALYDERDGRGFEYAYAAPGMARVVQAAGRLVRGPADRGVVALLGRRFLSEPFRSALPPAWLAGAEPEALVGDPAAAAAAFFGRAPD
jgi:DNA excision repair protein ERCC-2